MPLTIRSVAERVRRRLRPECTVFVFSGGGNLGATQVGMLRALLEAGIRPDAVLGCSVGAINGAAFADRPDIAGVARLERIWRRLADGDPDIMPNRKLLPLAAQLARRGPALHTQDRLEALLRAELGELTFAQLRVPFACVAADVDRAEPYWFDEGPLLPALLASAALPGVYPPVHLAGRRFFDGGVVNEVPIGHALALGATRVVLLHVGHLDERELDEARRPFDVLAHAYWTMRAARLDDELAHVPDDVELLRLPAGSTPRLRFDDFSRGPELSAMAYEASSHYLRTGLLPVPRPGPVSTDAAAEDAQESSDGSRSMEEGPDGSAVERSTSSTQR